MSCHGKVTHYRDGFGVKNKWTETCGLLSLLHLGLLFCHINIRTGPHYTPLPRRDRSAGSAPCTARGCAGQPHPQGTPPTPPPGTAWDPPGPVPWGGGAEGPAARSCATTPTGVPTAFPAGTTASPPFTRAGSAGTWRLLSTSGDVIPFYSVFFLPWGPRGRVAGGELAQGAHHTARRTRRQALGYLLNMEGEKLKKKGNVLHHMPIQYYKQFDHTSAIYLGAAEQPCSFLSR